MDRESNPYAMRQRQNQSYKASILFHALDRLSGHNKRHNSEPVSRSRSYAPQFITQRTSSYQAPPPLYPSLPPRKRCLTPQPSEHKAGPVLEFHEQEQSPLFKLPEESRLLVFEYVLGNRILHIVRRRGRLGHIPCETYSHSQGECNAEHIRGLKLPTGFHQLSGAGYGNIIQLLQTCQKVYIDAIQVLYTSNVFDLDCMESYICFSTAILPQRLDSIQHLELNFRFNLSSYFAESTPRNDLPRWERTCRVLGSMRSLRNLKMRITWEKLDTFSNEEKRYLEPLNVVASLDNFEISLPRMRKGEVDLVLDKDTPYRIVRRS